MRAGVIGLGRHGLRHIAALEKIATVKLVAVCDQRAEAVAGMVEGREGVAGYTDWQQLLETEKLDLVSVVTNGPSHAPITIAAARRNVRYVMCEKPMATSVKDAREMIEVAHEHGTRLAVAHARRWVKSYRALRDLISGGVIGDPAHFSFICGGGLFAGNGSHTMDLARMLSGSEPVSVSAFIDRTGTPNPRGSHFRDPGAVAIYRFANGMRLVIDMFEDLGVVLPTQIVGGIGYVTIDEASGSWKVMARKGADRNESLAQYWLPLVDVPFEAAALDMVEMLIDGISELIGDGPLSCRGEDGLASLEMVLGAHVSDLEGNRPVSLPLAESYHGLDIPLT